MVGGYLRPRPGPRLTRDEELGKRDDDFRPKAKSSLFTTLITPSKWRKRRILLVLATFVLVYLFVHNIPTDLGPIDQRIGVPRPQASPEEKSTVEPKGAPPKARSDEGGGAGQYYFNGPIKFYRLGASLHAAARTGGNRPTNQNILFAASSLKSVANLIPLACEMAFYKRTYVHFAVMARDDLPMDTILEINGVQESTCPIFFHDARPDYAQFSTEVRAELAAGGAMEHLGYYLHPQAVIMDDSLREETFFTRATRVKVRDGGPPLIELPADKYEDFYWMTRLDSKSIASWFRPTIDILIHAPPGGAGGIIRLMKSLLKADYTGLRVPKITIEMPPEVHPFVTRYLEDLEWPPAENASPIQSRTLSLRHRISSNRVTSEEASIRFFESFYPSNSEDNHVLVLSPQTELSPLYLHYLLYILLEYKYSAYDYAEKDSLFGISLDVPTSFINGSADFVRPTMANMNDARYTDDKSIDKLQTAFFTYQAPSSSASLIFGDKWLDLHNFLSNRLTASRTGKTQKTQKMVSESEPSWLEYVFELMRARGWATLHPPTSFATVHNELLRTPEEYVRPQKSSTSEASSAELDRLKSEPFLLASNAPSVQPHFEERLLSEKISLHRTLPLEGDLPELPHIPAISHLGHIGTLETIDDLRDDYVKRFRREVGGCDEATANKQRLEYGGLTDDLFCLPGQELEFVTFGGRNEGKSVASMSSRVLPAKATQVPVAAAAKLGTTNEGAAKAEAVPVKAEVPVANEGAAKIATPENKDAPAAKPA